MNQRNHWMPFNSLFDGNQEKEKMNIFKFDKPVLSDEQITLIENTIIEAYTESVPVVVTHYQKYNFIKSEGLITKIDSIKKNITLNNKDIIYFVNIIEIFIKNT